MKNYLIFFLLVYLITFSSTMKGQPSIKDYKIGQNMNIMPRYGGIPNDGEKLRLKETLAGQKGYLIIEMESYIILGLSFIVDENMSLNKFNEFKKAIERNYQITFSDSFTFEDDEFYNITKSGYNYYISKGLKSSGKYRVSFSISVPNVNSIQTPIKESDF